MGNFIWLPKQKTCFGARRTKTQRYIIQGQGGSTGLKLHRFELGLTRALLGGGGEHPTLRFFEDSGKTAALRVAVFCIPYQPSISHLF